VERRAKHVDDQPNDTSHITMKGKKKFVLFVFFMEFSFMILNSDDSKWQLFVECCSMPSRKLSSKRRNLLFVFFWSFEDIQTNK